MRILIVEDEDKTSSFLSRGLRESGFLVDTSPDGERALLLVLERSYDLVILDVMLPGIDGWEVLRQIRARGLRMPILFLTARDAVDDRVRGLDAGADDYLLKPFAFSEVLARVRTLMRRPPIQAREDLCVADLEIDLVRQRATRSGVRLDLTAKEFALLGLLVRRHGEVLSRTFIAEQVWDVNFDSDGNVVDVAIRRLRSKLDDPFEKKLIHTVRGTGYVLEDRT
ncbi:MAG: two component heavy metal response transcriptional regulator, winged helix family [Panacagrimonas sp.]|jgi:two-component system copper resistance phosphate regulon response regulator CusR|nr:heavy metal response regulator transcription factor [Panacagrimonas sp.]MCC2659103.1 two component heavy metal response transcriptional regulator, winged helix family [Panacagrimonas sp.]